ncbi:NADH:ubiquinone oxidoreductase [Photobacterium nomapromontoriensis]|uniref:NADH:ubiquinone oxidoreductase n=1 Tax=Photobacterium nomapromontoriensis TaxID=2910237 RepID=UPI003D11C0F8
MKFGLILLFSTFAGVLSGEHFHSFMAGFGIAAIAVGSAYWLAFRCSARYPQLAFLMLLMGLMAKIGVTITGVLWGIEAQVINSPFVFSLSYLFFAIVVTYLYSVLRERQMAREAAKSAKELAEKTA